MADLNRIDDNFSIGSEGDPDVGIGVVKTEKVKKPRKGKTPKKKRKLNEQIKKA